MLCRSLQLCVSLSVGNCVAEIEGDTAPEEHPPRMHWELLSSVQGQNAKAHLGANLLRIWDDGCFYDSEAYSVSNCVDLWSYPHKTSLVLSATCIYLVRGQKVANHHCKDLVLLSCASGTANWVRAVNATCAWIWQFSLGDICCTNKMHHQLVPSCNAGKGG